MSIFGFGGRGDETTKVTGLTASEHAALEELLELVERNKVDLTLLLAPTDEPKKVCLLRYLRATNFRPTEALRRLSSSVKFRVEMRVDKIIDLSADEALGFDAAIFDRYFRVRAGGFDRQGRPLLIFRKEELNLGDALRFATGGRLQEFLVWVMEHCLRLLRESSSARQRRIEDFTVIVDVQNMRVANVDTATISLLQALFNCLQMYYPGRLYRIFVVNAEPVLEYTMQGFTLSPETAAKVSIFTNAAVWRGKLHALIDPSQLPTEYGGSDVPLGEAPADRLESSRGAGSGGGKLSFRAWSSGGAAAVAAAARAAAAEGGDRTGGSSGAGDRAGIAAHTSPPRRRSSSVAGLAGSPPSGAKGDAWAASSSLEGQAASAAVLWAGDPSAEAQRTRGGLTVAQAQALLAAVVLLAMNVNAWLLQASLLVYLAWLLRDEWPLQEVRLAVSRLYSKQAAARQGNAFSRRASGSGSRFGRFAASSGSPIVLVGCMLGRGDSGPAKSSAKRGTPRASGSGSSGRRKWWQGGGVGPQPWDLYCVSAEAGMVDDEPRVVWRRLTDFAALRAALLKTNRLTLAADARVRAAGKWDWRLPTVRRRAAVEDQLQALLSEIAAESVCRAAPETRAFFSTAPAAASAAGSAASNASTLAGSTPPRSSRPASLSGSTRSEAASLQRRQQRESYTSSAAATAASVATLPLREGIRAASHLASAVATVLPRASSAAASGWPRLDDPHAAAAAEAFNSSSPAASAKAAGSAPVSPGTAGRSASLPPSGAAVAMAAAANAAAAGGAANRGGPSPTGSATNSPSTARASGGLESLGEEAAGAAGLGLAPEGGLGDMFVPVPDLTVFKLPHESNAWVLQHGETHATARPAGSTSGSGGSSSSEHDTLTRLGNKAFGLAYRISSKVSHKTQQLVEGRRVAHDCFGRLVAADLVSIPGGSHARADHVAGMEGGLVAARVAALAADPSISFLHVVNLQFRGSSSWTSALDKALQHSPSLDDASVSSASSSTGGGGMGVLGASNSTTTPAAASASSGKERPSVSIVCYWDCPVSELDPASVHDQVLRELFLRYIDMPYSIGDGGLRPNGESTSAGRLDSKDFRNLSLKVIPCVSAGQWLTKTKVDDGSPHRLGKHLTVRYFRGINYVETDVDLGSSLVARDVSSLLLKDSSRKLLTLDMALYLEGSSQVLGAIRFRNVRVSAARPLLADSSSYYLTANASLASGADGAKGNNGLRFARTDVQRIFRDSGATHRFKVRGESYLLDRTKVPAGEAVAKLVHVGLYTLARKGAAGRVDNAAAAAGTATADVTRRLLETYGGDHTLFVLNFQEPAAMMVVWWAVPTLQDQDPGSLSRDQKRFLDLWRRFSDLPMCSAGQSSMTSAADLLAEGGDGDFADKYERQKLEGKLFDGELPDDDFRVQRLKMFVNVNKGPWMARTAVNNATDRPLLLAKHVKTRFFRGLGYLEADVDLTSSVAAFNAASVVTDCKELDLDVAVCIGADTAEDLPERLLGSVGLVVNPKTIAMAGGGAKNVRGILERAYEPLHRDPAEVAAAQAKAAAAAEKAAAAAAAAGGAEHGDALSGLSEEGEGGDERLRNVGSGALTGMFQDAGPVQHFDVRGASYAADRVKVHAAPPSGPLLRADLFRIDSSLGRVDHLASQGRAARFVASVTARAAGGGGNVPFLFLANFQVPGDPPVSMVSYWALPFDPFAAESTGPDVQWDEQKFRHLFHKFVDLPLVDPETTDTDHDPAVTGQYPASDFRNQRFKLFVSLVKAPWVVKKAIGSKPALLAQKLTCRWFRGPGYLECDIDIGSSRVAYQSTSLAAGYASALVCDLAFAIEGSGEAELPERLIGVVRVNRVDFRLAEPLYDEGNAFLATDLPSIVTSSVSEAALQGMRRPSAARRDSIASAEAMQLATSAAAAGPLMEGHSDAFGSHMDEQEEEEEGFGGAGGEMAAGAALPADMLTSRAMRGMFEDSGASHNHLVRSASYLLNRQKIHAGDAVGTLVRADAWLETEPWRMEEGRRVDHIVSKGRVKTQMQRLLNSASKPFLLVANLQLPAGGGRAISLLFTWVMPPSIVGAAECPPEDRALRKLFRRFIDLPLSAEATDDDAETDEVPGSAASLGQVGPDDFRSKRLKLFPAVVEAPWLVRKAVGNKPTLLAQKLTCRWFRGERYLELDIDVGSSKVALQATSLAMGAAKSLVLDLGFNIQSEEQEELPERILGSVRLKHVDVELAKPIYDGGLDFDDDDDYE